MGEQNSNYTQCQLLRESSFTLLALSLPALKCCCRSYTLLYFCDPPDSWDVQDPLLENFASTRESVLLSSFQQIINKSSPEPLICSYPNSFSHLSKKWLHVIVFRPLHGSLGNTGKVKHLNINRSNEQQNGRTSFKFTGCSIISSLLCLTQ